ncbi:acyltransferase family protein [Gimibacter soli]|uniref:Acyltransferase n=1 Tax=Gimibacter soli TaxID=3024400 RepID=A0AAF0BMP6_9PROT|nr:acyltransferase [Gimibacter soli]WCL54796.1 acyltransferase [Gimibacter soli]
MATVAGAAGEAGYFNVRTNKEYAERIDRLRIFAVLGIMIFHLPPLVTYQTDPDRALPVFSSDWILFLKIASQTLIPGMMVLTMITGLLIFGAQPAPPYGKSVRKWTQRLFVPFLIWTVPFSLLVAVLQSFGLGKEYGHQLGDFELWPLIDSVFGITTFPVNVPMYFTRSMFVLLLLSPVIWWVVRRTGPLLFLIFAALKIGQVQVPVLYSWSICAGFALGAYLVLQPEWLDHFEQHGGKYLAAALGLLMVSALIRFMHYGQNVRIATITADIADFFMLPGTWWLGRYFAYPRLAALFKRLNPYNFALFAAHVPLIHIYWNLFEAWFGSSANPAYTVFFFLHPVLLVVSILYLSKFAEWLSPTLWGYAVGGRTRNELNVRKERAVQTG